MAKKQDLIHRAAVKHYEKGKYATFIFRWNDKLKQLSISDTKGSFAGDVAETCFSCAFSESWAWRELEVTDKTVSYSGEARC